MRMRLSLVPALLVMLCGTILTACETTPTTATTGSDAVRVACGAFTTITYSGSGDTEQTRKEIAAHNRAYVELCEPQP